MIFDTDVFIWAFRGRADAMALMSADRSRAISVITLLELLQGVRDREELRRTKDFIAVHDFTIMPLTDRVGQRATLYVEQHALSFRIGVTDALIAATAVEAGQPLCSGNRKHFDPIRELDFRPYLPGR